MNLNNLYTTARVIRSVYQIISTTLLLIYIAKRVSSGRKVPRNRRGAAGLFDGGGTH